MSSESSVLNPLKAAQRLLQQGRLPEAELLCRQVLAHRSKEFHALHLLGIVALQRQDQEQAQRWFKSAIAANPAHPAAHSNLSVVLLALRQPREALEEADAALRLQPDFAQGWTNRANALEAMGKSSEALSSFECAINLGPGLFDAHFSRGNLLLELRQYEAALDSLDQALRIHPNHSGALNNRGSALRRLRRPREAIESYQRALQLQPDNPNLMSNIANALLALELLPDALEFAQRALALNPRLTEALNIRATALRDLGRQDEAAAAYARLLEVAPAFDYAMGNCWFARANTCDWSDHAAQVSGIIEAVGAGRRASTPFSLLAMSHAAGMQLQCATAYVADRCPPSRTSMHRVRRRPRIRLAYFSGDFSDHAVSYLLAGLFERHDPGRFETLAISLRPQRASALTQRMKRAFAHFVDISGRSNPEVAALLADIEVDIAVDLAGFTAGMRPEIFARGAAPIQVNYLGYPGTMGPQIMDYVIADEFVIPPDSQPQYGEKVIYLPDCFQCFDDRRESPAGTPERRALGLPEGAFVFCCFNNHYKINPTLFDIWMRLLDRIPSSVLWLLGDQESVRRNLRREARQRGVDPKRIVFADRRPYAQHLARLLLADLFLDCLPFNAGATASDALSMGLPVLTVSGEAFASRMAGSLLTALGMRELICADLSDYETRAYELAVRPDELRALRQRLIAARENAPLFDTDRFRRHLESAYEHLWAGWQRGDSPESFSVPRI